jgi:hypothetical protein
VAVEKSEFNYPNKMGYIYLTAIEEEIGPKAIAAVLTLAQIPEYINNYPPDNLAREFDFAHLSVVGAALEEMYGPRGERGLGLHAGKACFTRGRDAFASLSGLGELALKAIPFQTKIKIGLKGMAEAFSKFSDQVTSVDESETHFIYTIHRCPVCWGRTNSKPICYVATGIIESGLQWLSQGQIFEVEEVACQAMGEEACIIHISKEPFNQKTEV